MKTKIVHCKKEPYDVYIGRPSKFGNPFEIGRDGTREEVIFKFKLYAKDNPIVLRSLQELKGKTLGCHCRPEKCHGDAIIEIIEEQDTPITIFKGVYDFLSNSDFCSIIYKGIKYKSAEQAYQAQKAKIASERDKIAAAPTPKEAKRLGRSCVIVDNWEEIKVQEMINILLEKFSSIGYLRMALLRTGVRPLIEVNSWGDTFWGVCGGEGENMLGEILMEIRETLFNELLLQRS
jgi:ribA/ribD-fused uncharacterized protein